MASLARIIWWTRSPPVRPTVAITAVRITAGSARATTAPTRTATPKMNNARLAIRTPRKPNAVNAFDRSTPGVIAPT